MEDWRSDCCDANVLETWEHIYICEDCNSPCKPTRVFIKGDDDEKDK